MENILQERKELLKGKRVARAKERLFLWSIIIYQVVNFIIFYVVLNFNSILLSFQKIDPKTFEVSWVGLDNYVHFFKTFATAGNDYWNALKNSLISYGVSIGFSLPVGIFFAFYVYKKAIGSGAFRFIVMIPTILSGMVVGLMFKRFMYALPGFMNNTLGFKNFPELMSDPKWTFFTTVYYGIWHGFASAVIYYSNAMNTIDDEIVESAQLDGITYLKELWLISLPMIMPTLTTFLVTGFADILSEQGPLYLFWAYDAPRETYRWGYLIFQATMKDGQAVYPRVAAIGIISTLVMFPLTMLVKKGLEKLDPMSD